MIEGKEFIALNKQDRKLARALGIQIGERNPWEGNHFLMQLANIRDSAVDSLIHRARMDDDPCGDADDNDSPLDVQFKKGRMKLFEASNVPASIEIVYPGFTTAEGMRIPDTTLNVISTPKRGTTVTMEATDRNLDFILTAAQNCDHEPQIASPRAEVLLERL